VKVRGKSVTLARCGYFTVNRLELNTAVEKDYLSLDSFVILMCVSGSFTIRYYDKEEEKVTLGETVLLPADLKAVQYIPDQSAIILEVYIEGLVPVDRSEELLDSLF
jgi:mannose-6-phosphate isomerase